MRYYRISGILLPVLFTVQLAMACPERRRKPALCRLATLCYIQGAYEDGVMYALQAGKKGEWIAGCCYYKLGQRAQAKVYLQACLQRQPTQAEALQAMAHICYDEASYRQAVLYWERLLQLQPQNKYVKFMLGKSYIGEGEKEKGNILCDEATAL